MSSFNEYFRNRGAKIIVDRFFKGIDIFNPDAKITSITHSIVEEPEQPASYYIENGLTATHRVRVEYTINEDPEIRYSYFEVPKEIDGSFIIEGSYRIATNTLGSNYDCRIKIGGVGDNYINFDYNRQYNIDKRVLRVNILNEFGMPDKTVPPMMIKYDDIDNVSPETKELLKLTEDQVKKLEIKLDLDYTPEYIDTKIINACIMFGDDRLKDLIIDKTIESVASGFITYMFRSNNGRNYISARSVITNNFTKFSKIMDDVTTISNLAFKYFKGSSEIKGSDQSLQIPSGSVNAINLESVNDKITVPESCAVNTTMTDLIDMADTPINQSTNLINALTVSTHLTDDGSILFDVYTKDFTKVTIKYIDYLNSKVCASEFVDYKENKVVPNENGEVEVKYRMKRKMVKADEIDFVDLHPDYRLSKVTRRIPFINSTDSEIILTESIKTFNCGKKLYFNPQLRTIKLSSTTIVSLT